MQAIGVSDAQRKLPELIEQVLADAEPRIVVTDSGAQVVVMPLEEFNAWQETLYLMKSPANLAHLRQGMLEVEAADFQPHALIPE